MKSGKRPTLRQKKEMERNSIDPMQWLVVKDTTDEMLLIHRYMPNKTKRVLRWRDVV